MQSHGGSRRQVGLARRRRDETGSVDCADAQRSKPKPPSPEQSARCRTTPVSIRLDSDEGPGPGGPGPNSSDPRNPPLGKRPFTDARPIAFALYTHIAAHPLALAMQQTVHTRALVVLASTRPPTLYTAASRCT